MKTKKYKINWFLNIAKKKNNNFLQIYKNYERANVSQFTSRGLTIIHIQLKRAYCIQTWY